MRKAAAPLSYAACPRTGLSAFLPERVLSRRTGGTYTPAPMSAVTCEARGSASYVSEGSALVPRRPRLLDTVRDALRLRHPAEMGATEVSRFLSSLAVEGRVSASTQNQALARSEER